MDKNKRNAISYGFGIILIVLGIVFEGMGLGRRWFAGFDSLGSWLIYVGFISIAIATIRVFSKKERKVDERMMFVASKANRITFLAIIIAAFAIMVADGLAPITVPYHMFMAYLICGILLVYAIAYKILLKYN